MSRVLVLLLPALSLILGLILTLGCSTPVIDTQPAYPPSDHKEAELIEELMFEDHAKGWHCWEDLLNPPLAFQGGLPSAPVFRANGPARSFVYSNPRFCEMGLWVKEPRAVQEDS